MNRSQSKERLMTIALSFTVLLSLVIAILAIHLGRTVDHQYYAILLISLAGLVISMFLYQRLVRMRTINLLRQRWGKESKDKRNITAIRSVFDLQKVDNGDKAFIDDQTWQDIHMDEVFSKLDRTLTTPGEQVLYDILRTPLADEQQLIKRDQYINLFKDNEELSIKVQQYLYRLGKDKNNQAVSLLWKDINIWKWYNHLSKLMAILAVLSLALVYIMGFKAIFFIVLPIYAVNFAFYSKVQREVSGDIPGISYINSLITEGKNIGNIKDACISEYTKKLKLLSDKLRKISRKTRMLSIPKFDPLGISEHLSIFFLVEARGFFDAMEGIKELKEELRELYVTIGELDAIISVASYRHGLGYYTSPRFINLGNPILEVVDIAHPLIENPVFNSISLDGKNAMITGSNMSGKSTFLRTLAINAILAQSIYTCIAREYNTSFFKVMTSISPSDNLLGGKSYYLAEAEALLRMVNNLDKKIYSLCIIDEIFRGTNSVERVEASTRLLQYLPKNNAMVVVATHDLEIAQHIGQRYNNYHFRESVSQQGLEFDYTLKEGISNTRNGIKILKYLGYPQEVTG